MPDVETYRALLPALATTKGMMIGISSPYRKAGLLYSKHKTSFGVDDPQVLVIQARTEQLNPTIDSEHIARARIADSAAASRSGMLIGEMTSAPTYRATSSSAVSA